MKVSNFSLLFIVQVLTSTTYVNAQALTDIVRVCPRNVKDYQACLKNSIESLRPRLSTGDFGAIKFQGIDPIAIDDIIINKPGIDGRFSRLIAVGASGLIIDKIKMDLNAAKWDSIITIPKLEAVGVYEMKLNNGLRLHGKGQFKAIIPNMKLRLSFRGKIVSRNGDQFLEFDSTEVLLKISSIKLQLDNLFPNKELNDVANAVINQGSEMFTPEVETAVRNSLSKRFHGITKILLDQLPLRVLYP